MLQFQIVFAFLYDQMIGPLIFEGRLTGLRYLRFRQEELPQFFFKYLAFCKGGLFIFNMTELLIFHVCLEISLTIVSLCDGLSVGSPKLANQVTIDNPVGLLCVRMYSKSTVYRAKFERRDVLIGVFRMQQFASRTPSGNKDKPSALFTLERRSALRLSVGILKMFLEQMSVHITLNIMKLNVYVKLIM